MTLRAVFAFLAAVVLWSALGSPVQAHEPAQTEDPWAALCQAADRSAAPHLEEPPAPPVDPVPDGVELLPSSDQAASPCAMPMRPEPLQAEALASAWLPGLMRPPCPRARQA